jgi:hypothetical protein
MNIATFGPFIFALARTNRSDPVLEIGSGDLGATVVEISTADRHAEKAPI